MAAMRTCTLGILSDIHYASAAEKARGKDYELREITNPLVRAFATAYRRFVWLREPLAKNFLLDQFLEQRGAFDYVIANGDYSCDSAFLGLSDDAACESARECLGKLRQRFGARLRANYGDHELGKRSMFSARGGLRLASWRRARQDLGLPPMWQIEIGRYVLLGFPSSLVALPVFAAEMLPEERSEWERLRAEHLAEITAVFAALRPDQKMLLFCHDPTALPFLWREESCPGQTAANRADDCGPFAFQPRAVEGSPARGDAAHPISGPHGPAPQHRVEPGPLLAPVPRAPLPRAGRHRTVERRRILHRRTRPGGAASDPLPLPSPASAMSQPLETIERFMPIRLLAKAAAKPQPLPMPELCTSHAQALYKLNRKSIRLVQSLAGMAGHGLYQRGP